MPKTRVVKSYVVNAYGVPARVWTEWDENARWMFNRMYWFLIHSEKDIVVGGYEPVARFASALAADITTGKRMLIHDWYFGPKGFRAEQLRRKVIKGET